MDRDYKVFPDDENGDVLWRMSEHGDNLDQQREVDFCVIFPSEAAAIDFAVLMLRSEQKVSFSAYEGNPWQVLVHPFRKPTHEGITRFETPLGEDAAQFGGRNDGWGSLSQA